MINILLDTNVFRKDPQRKKVGFEVISKLARTNYIKVHIPKIVLDEFTTWLESDEKAPFDDLLHDLGKLKKRNLSSDDNEFLLNLDNKIRMIQMNRLTNLKNDLDLWIKSINATIYEVEAHHGINVIESYFKGLPPFSAIKNRNDFPDAFIWQVILDLLKKFPQLSVISEDKNILNSLKDFKDVDTYNNIEEFVASEKIRKNLFDKFGEIYFTSIINNLEKDSAQLDLHLQKNLINKIAYENVKINYDVDSVDAFINLVGEITDLHYDYGYAEYYGDGLIGIPFSFNADVYIEYDIDSSMISFLQDTRPTITSISGSYNDHYSQIEEEVGIYCQGLLSLQIKDINTENLVEEIKIEDLLKDINFEIDSIDSIELTT